GRMKPAGDDGASGGAGDAGDAREPDANEEAAQQDEEQQPEDSGESDKPKEEKAAKAEPAAGGNEKQTVAVPDLGDFSDVEIIEVHVSDGDEIGVDDPLITLETDKAAMDVPSTVS